MKSWTDWAQRQARSGTPMSPGGFAVSPILNSNGIAEYDLMVPVYADTLVGYLVNTYALGGTGQQAIAKLVGEGTVMLLGEPGGTWTDLEKPARAPPAAPEVGVPYVFDRSSTGPGIGVTLPIPRTPWYVSLRQPQGLVLAPVRDFVWKMVWRAAVISLAGALIVWLLSRRITLRIARLTKDVDRLDPDETPPPEDGKDGPDEIARLCAAFERMSLRIKKNQDLEAQLRQAQKLEAVGRLAGGVAHDFNNILTVIRNYSEMVRESLPPNSEPEQDLTEVLRATDRARGLTDQLLAFSRRQAVTPRVLKLNQVIQSSERMLRRLIPAHIEFMTFLDAGVGYIRADAGQIEQILLNLTINAMDAMPAGGRLTIHSRIAELDDSFRGSGGASIAGNSSLTPGRYASIVVTDTGTGMDRETLSRIFDPFFTTKPVGKGTGLGLATVHGIVTQSRGRLWVYSEPGRGTTFKLYFPSVTSEAGEPIRLAPVKQRVAYKRASETILVVEDDAATRKVTRRLLAKAGYTIFEASNGLEALEVIGSHKGPIHLVLTDLMMPSMTGVELAARLATLKPELPVAFMSGYADRGLFEADALSAPSPFIEKPFTASKLLDFVRAELHLPVGV